MKDYRSTQDMAIQLPEVGHVLGLLHRTGHLPGNHLDPRELDPISDGTFKVNVGNVMRPAQYDPVGHDDLDLLQVLAIQGSIIWGT